MALYVYGRPCNKPLALLAYEHWHPLILQRLMLAQWLDGQAQIAAFARYFVAYLVRSAADCTPL